MRQPHVLLFDAYAFDPQAGALWVNGVPLTLRPKAATILDHLLRHPGALVTRQELLDAAWPGIAVVDDGLTQCVTDIRQALGPDGPRLLRTVRGRGYILAATVASGALPARTLPSPASAAPSQSRRVWALAVLGAIVLSFPLAALMPRPAPEPRRASPEAPQAAAVPRPAPDARLVAHGLVEQGLMIQSGPGAYADRLRESLPLFRRAVATDPNSAAAAAEAAFVHGNLLLIRASTDPTFDRDEATRYADLAMAANANDPLALAARAVALRHTGRYGEALVYYRQAGADPERLSARANVGVMQLLLGNAEAAIEPLRAALVESPRHRFADTWRVYLAIAELLAGRPGFGASLLMTSVPAGAVVSREERMLYRAAALTLDGREEAAREVLAELRRGSPEVLERPLSEHALSQEPAFLALYQERFVAPLTRLGLK
jgi:DNA-binding winged helix-turn-helix (wHTH) protein